MNIYNRLRRVERQRQSRAGTVRQLRRVLFELIELADGFELDLRGLVSDLDRHGPTPAVLAGVKHVTGRIISWSEEGGGCGS